MPTPRAAAVEPSRAARAESAPAPVRSPLPLPVGPSASGFITAEVTTGFPADEPPVLEAHRARRVLITTDAIGGVWNYSMTLAESLGASGADVLVAVLGPEPDAGQRAEARAVPRLKLETAPFALEWMDGDPHETARGADWLLGLERTFAPDVVHLSGYSQASIPWRAPRLVVAHACMLTWWREVERTDAPQSFDAYRRRVVDGLRNADVVVAPTRRMLDWLGEIYGPLRDARVIRSGTDLERWRPLEKQPFILAAGRVWDRGRNLALLSEVAPRVGWPIHVAGSVAGTVAAPPAAECDPVAARPGGVRFLGHLHPLELAGWMGHASVFVHPALYEPFGLTTLEAASAGCALVLADLPTLRELWDGAALFVDPRDADDVARTLRRLEDDPDALRAWAALARERSREFGASRMHAQYHGLYAELIAARAGRAAIPVLHPVLEVDPSALERETVSATTDVRLRAVR